jgi:hypothetical protein
MFFAVIIIAGKLPLMPNDLPIRLNLTDTEICCVRGSPASAWPYPGLEGTWTQIQPQQPWHMSPRARTSI